MKSVDDSCEIVLLSLKGRCYENKFYFVLFGHFPERTLFLSCSDSSRSTCCMLDSFRIVELLQICYGFIVGIGFVADML